MSPVPSPPPQPAASASAPADVISPRNCFIVLLRGAQYPPSRSRVNEGPSGHTMSLRSVALAGALAALPAPAAAHVAASEDVNNRYLKVSPMADRVRLAY